MRVLITGSRDWRDVATIRGRLVELPTGSIVVHGAASGADAIAHSIGEAIGLTPEPHWPDFENYHVSEAPKVRNALMVSLGADVCLAFPTARSRGTYHCAGLAEQAGIPVEWFKETS